MPRKDYSKFECSEQERCLAMRKWHREHVVVVVEHKMEYSRGIHKVSPKEAKHNRSGMVLGVRIK